MKGVGPSGTARSPAGLASWFPKAEVSVKRLVREGEGKGKGAGRSRQIW